MLLTRLYLRNFRVYEDELDLLLPPGLVGIYGPNGSGKSTLLEAILFTLWGRARTPKEQIRSAGVGAECVTELEFEHEGHLYVVRRILSGINATMKAEAQCDGLIMSEGVRDTGRYLHSVLGMDDAAFRASVFAEQKQLAAFSSQTPADRRRLVLQLLGITPLDGARDAARRDARNATEQHRHLRDVLPDLEVLRVAAEDAQAAADAAMVAAADEERAWTRARELAGAASDVVARMDEVRQTYDGLVIEGKAARAELDSATATVDELTSELEQLAQADAGLAAAERVASTLGRDEQRVTSLQAVIAALDASAAIVVPPEPPEVDDAALSALRRAAMEALEAQASAEGQRAAAIDELHRAEQQAARSETLSGEQDCPVCGQALGEAFSAVQRHRGEEVAQARARRDELDAVVSQASEVAKRAAQAATDAESTATRRRIERDTWLLARQRHADADAALRIAVTAADHVMPTGSVTELLARAGRAGVAAELSRVATAVDAGRVAAKEVERLRGRLERRPTVLAALQSAAERKAISTTRVEALRDKLRSLAFEPKALDAARDAAREATAVATDAEHAARRATITAAEVRTRAEAAAARLADGQELHGRLAGLESEVRHLSRVADLLAEFRNTVVASVGPRLALQAAELFAELTDHEYDELQVDPETYELQISDAGRSYGLDRFSGSEVDLANLALRVAISEHIRFQSGGSVGLLVLDEVFGPLDQDRKDRMLLALERLKGRFRQILVVTHDPNVKEQMPAAIEVVKRSGRRATARVVS